MQIYLMQNVGTTDGLRLYVQAVAKRCCLMDKMESGWDHYARPPVMFFIML